MEADIDPIIGSEYPKKVVPMIDLARFSVDIMVFDWRVYPHEPGNPVNLFNAALVRAKRRGVKIRALVNSPVIRKFLDEAGIEHRAPSGKALMHAKLILIDKAVGVIGSHNFSQYAFTFNTELSLYFASNQVAQTYAQYFDHMWGL